MKYRRYLFSVAQSVDSSIENRISITTSVYNHNGDPIIYIHDNKGHYCECTSLL